MEELRNNLFKLINEANLPPEAIYYICKDFYREVSDSYQTFLLNKKNNTNEPEETNED